MKDSLPFWIVLIMGLGLFTSHVIGFQFTHFPGDMGDGRLNMYCLEHAHRFITGQSPSLWDAPFMFPEKQVITYSENLVGSAPVYSLFRLCGADRELAYQLWYVALCILNYTFAYFFIKSFTKNSFAAALGAFVFAFSLSLQSQMTHAQTFPRFAIPIAFWMAYLFYQNLKIKYFFLLSLAIVYQFYCSIYLGMMLLPVMAILIISILLVQHKLLWKHVHSILWSFSFLSSVAIAGISLYVLIWPYYLRSVGQPIRSLQEVWITLPTPASYVYSQPGSLIWDGLSKVGSNLPACWDHQLFPGLLTILCVPLSLILILRKKDFRINKMPDRKWMIVLLVLLTITFFGYINARGIKLYEYLFNLPGYAALRSLTRIINIELIFFAALVAFVYLRLIQIEKIKKWPLLTFGIAFGLLVFDNYFREGKSYRTEVSEHKLEMEHWGELVKDLPKGKIVSFEVDSICENATRHQISAMLCAQDYELVCLNGYTSISPVWFDAYWNNPNEQTRKIWLSRMNFPEEQVQVIRIPRFNFFD